jgi:hypothetical protein
MDVVPAAWNYLTNVIQGTLTDSIRMKTYEGLTLNNPHARGLIEQHFQQPGNPVPRPYLNMKGNFYRDQPGQPSSQSYPEAQLTGTLKLDEKQADMLYSFFKRHEMRVQKERAAIQNSMVDDLLGGDKEGFKSKVKRYIDQGGDPKNLGRDLKDTMVQRKVPAMQGELLQGGGKGSLPFAKKLQDMKPYLQNNPLWGNNQPSQPQKETARPIAEETGIGGKPIYNDTEPPSSSSQQIFRPADSRYRNDVIDPQVNGQFDRQGLPMNPSFPLNKWTKDKMPTEDRIVPRDEKAKRKWKI